MNDAAPDTMQAATAAPPCAPTHASCRCQILNSAGQRVTMTVTATRRPRADRADVKCGVAGAPALAARLVQVLRQARLTEQRFDSRDQVVIGMDQLPAPGQRDWELAAVLADRMVRGAVRLAGAVLAQGWSDQWHSGRIDGHAWTPPAQGEAAVVLLGGAGAGPGCLPHLGMLTGRPDQAAAVSTARAWFPLHSGGINDSLCWVEVAVYPLAAGAAAALDEEDTIAAPGLDVLAQAALRRTLAAARRFDAQGVGRWRSVVRFGQSRFHGNSWELAAVLADRVARGREWLPRGRIIATGCSADWQAGMVNDVDARAAKLALMLAQAVDGDRLLLPAAWEALLPAGFAEAVAARGASVACIAGIGLI